MLQDMIDRVSGRSAGAAKALTDALRVLKVEGQDAYERAVAYVLDGSGPEILSDLAGRDLDVVDQLLERPGSVNPYSAWVPDLVTARLRAVDAKWSLEQSSAARDRAYRVQDGATAVQLSRLARLLTTVAGTVDGETPGLPAWVALLANDVAKARFGRGHGKRGDAATQKALREQWTPGLLAEVVRAGGVPDAEVATTVVRALLHRVEQKRSWRQNPLDALLRHRSVADYLVEQRDAVAAVVPSLNAHGRSAFLDHVAAASTSAAHAPVVAELAADSAKTVRQEALALLAGLPEDEQLRLLGPLLRTAAPARLEGVVTRLATVDGGLAVVEAALDGATGTRATLLGKAVERARALDGDAEAPPAPVDVPPFEPLPETELGEDFVSAARAVLDKQLTRLTGELAAAEAAGSGRNENWLKSARKRLANLRETGDDELRDLAAFLSGSAVKRPATGVVERLVGRNAGQEIAALGPLTLLHRTRLVLLEHIGQDRLTSRGGAQNLAWRLREHVEPGTDLRAVAEVLRRCKVEDPDAVVMRLALQRTWNQPYVRATDAWPFFAERPALLERYLQPQSGYDWLEAPARVLEILRAFPALPAEVLPRVTALALGEGKTHRLAAQNALAAHPGARNLAEQGLADSKAEVRIAAARWIARLGDPAGVPALRGVLAKERREPVRAAFLTALEALGDDISADLAPQVLLAEATKGLRAKVPASLTWFPFDQLPAARWAAGGDVPREVVRWWVVLACKLKEPSGEGLLARYVSLLDEGSRAALGSFVLRAWIAQDTRTASADESRDYAERRARTAFDNAQQWAKQHPGVEWYSEQAAKTLDDHYREAYREHQAAYLGSAVKDKGLLALTVGMPGDELATATQQYLRAHQGRRAQAEALVRALAANGDRPAVQQLLAVSRRFKQKTVQDVATGLATELAERRGWSADQLADRTVQTAGFDDDGILRFGLGDREVTGRITPSFTIELRSPSGAAVKALPATRAGEDPEPYREAKAQLSASRKELKAVAALQTQRLHEAMCTGRSWTAAEWREFVLDHPVMSRLAARLVWLAEPGTPAQRAFRPGDGGALVAVDDEDVTLPDDATVALAHAVTLSAGAAGDDAAAWREHLADYEIVPLFDQLGVTLPDLPAGAVRISDRKGWLTDSFSIRGRATKLGWSRSAAEDGGWFTAYTKTYPSLGVTAEIQFTGAFLPEENIAAAVTDLEFRRTGTWGGSGLVPLADLPPVLVAESYRDYVTVAEAGAFDPDWERRSQY